MERVASSPRARVQANIEAIRLAQQLLREDRWATADEQRVLAGYTGWGAAATVFDDGNTEFFEAREELREVLNDQALYLQLAATTTDSFYTAPAVTEAITQSLVEAGVDRGRILEPGSGTGNFISALGDTGHVTGVEIDPISGFISSQLYPDTTVVIDSFADHDSDEPIFDAVVGNVPFGDTVISTNSTNPDGFLPHNHFINHSLSLLKPGGYAAFITSTGTSDSASDKARAAMIQKADLLAAYRLPRQTFRAIAGTDTVTDVLVFRGREADAEPTQMSLQWLQSSIVDHDGSAVRLNSLFASDESLFLGEKAITSNRFGAPQLTVNGDISDLGPRLKTALSSSLDTQISQGLTFSPAPYQSDDAYNTFLLTSEETPIPGTLRYQYQPDGSVLFEEYHHDGHSWEEVKPRRKSLSAEWVSLIDLRDAVLETRRADSSDDPETAKAARQRLNWLYDSYVAKYGPVNRFELVERKPTAKAIREALVEVEASYRIEHNLDPHDPLDDLTQQALEQEAQELATKPARVQSHLAKILNDPQMAQVLALEIFNDDTGEARKAQIFVSNPARIAREPQPTDSVPDAFHAVLAFRGTVAVDEIATLTGRSGESVTSELLDEGLVFRDPQEPESLITARDYLSGNVRTKLAEARLRASDDESFQANVAALEAVQPKWVEDITVRPGATWINPDYYTDYLVERLQAPPGSRVLFTGDQWEVEVDTKEWDFGGDADYNYGLIAANNSDGTRYNFQAAGPAANAHNQGVACNRNDGVAVPAFKTLQAVLNLTAPKGKWSAAWKEQHNTGEENPQASTFLKRKAESLADDFNDWLLSDPARRQEVLETYNQIYNAYVAPKYDGADLQLPGLGESFTPYAYQRNAVQRIISEPGVLLNHVVGAGKTGSMMMGAAELRRLGIAKQPWLVVPNHIAGQITREALQWYPNTQVLSAAGVSTKADRARFVAQTTAGDWDLVVVPQSVFERIPLGKDATIDYLTNKIEEINAAVDEARANGADQSSVTVKNLQGQAKTLIKKVEQAQARTDDALSFEQTPCDYVFVDEAHHYKNMGRVSQVDDLNSAGSHRAMDMEMKLARLRADKATADNPRPPVATFATGTPIANNLAEIWVMMKYLRPDLAAELHMKSVLGFAAAFTKQVTDVEVNASGTGLRQKTRTCEYVNVGELANATAQFMDVVTRDAVEENATRPLPKLKDGKNTVVEFEVEQDVKDFIADFDYRATYDWEKDPDHRRMPRNKATIHDELGRPIQVTGPEIDMALTIASDGKKVSLDPRLVNLDVGGPGARITELTGQVLKVWNETKDKAYTNPDGTVSDKTGGLQIIFCDQGTPGGASHNIYADIRTALAEQGMNPDRVQFIHDWKGKEDQLYRRCNAGDVDVIIGSTAKMGTGANIQTRAVALHHLDIPWRPADLEQREGRIIRQGNQNSDIDIFNYVAAGTFDAVMWQTLYRKQKFINQFYAADRTLRQMDSLDESSADAAAMNKAIATGDHRYVELFQLDKRINELTQMKREWQATRSSREYAIKMSQQQITSLGKTLDSLEPLVERAQKFGDADAEHRHREFRGKTFENRADAANHIISLCASIANNKLQQPQPLITLGGVDLQARYLYGEIEITVTNTVGLRSTRLSRAGIGDAFSHNPDSASSKAYGILTQLENTVKDIPRANQKAAATLASERDRLERLEREAHRTTFVHEEELAESKSAFDALQVDLENQSQSPEAIALRAEREERMRVKGRKPGWTQEFSPTKGYAIAVHDTLDRNEVIAKAQLRENKHLFTNGVITQQEYERKVLTIRSSAIGESLPQQSEEPAGQKKPATGLAQRLGIATSHIQAGKTVASGPDPNSYNAESTHLNTLHKDRGPDLANE